MGVGLWMAGGQEQGQILGEAGDSAPGPRVLNLHSLWEAEPVPQYCSPMSPRTPGPEGTLEKEAAEEQHPDLQPTPLLPMAHTELNETL